MSNLVPREAAYFKVTIPPNTPSWEITLDSTQGEMMLAVRRGTVPDCELFDHNLQYFQGVYPQNETPQYDPGDREVPLQKDGAERYVLLPRDGQDYLIAGDYYIGGDGEGQNPVDSNHTGTGTSSGTLTSRGALGVADLGIASLAGLSQPVTLASGQVKSFQFTVPPGTASLELRLDNRVGNPWMSLVGGNRIVRPEGMSQNNGFSYGFNGGQTSTGNGVDYIQNASIITVANPPPGIYSLAVKTAVVSGTFPAASADLVVIANTPVPVAFDSGTAAITNQPSTSWRYFQVQCQQPPGSPVGMFGSRT